jgi:uncharacterized repeat protein (TIGR03803 family)
MRFMQCLALGTFVVDEGEVHNLATFTRFNPGAAHLDNHATSSESERKSSGLSDWLLYSALAAIICADVIVALFDKRLEQQPVSVARPERYQVIQTFAATGRGPKAPMGLAVDKAGHLYGSTSAGGLGSWGTIFELIPPSVSGLRWEMRVLSNVDGKTIGTSPIWSIIGQDGDLYGMTNDGETVYKLKRRDDGWGEPVSLYRFTERLSPLGTTLPELIPDKFGSLYGTTAGRGGTDAGTVFKLNPGPDGWTETVLHRFARGDDDGGYPNGGLTIDKAGTLYGTTSGGGQDGLGTVFKLTPTDHGWQKTLLHIFRQLDGSSGKGGLAPMAGLTLGDDGTLYGTASGGGQFGEGVVFALTPSDHDSWSYRVLYDFKRGDGDGAAPNSRLVFGKSGALYGTTKFGGNASGYDGFGTVFKLASTAAGWGEVVLHSFTGGADGAQPTGALIRDPSGNLFGTTAGTARSGVDTGSTVFEIETGAISESNANAPFQPE